MKSIITTHKPLVKLFKSHISLKYFCWEQVDENFEITPNLMLKKKFRSIKEYDQ